MNSIELDRKQLIAWYQQNKRDLPWRNSKDPYRIWISEVMLQQTTVAAVIPFYEKFMTRFPNVQQLAKASIEDVYVLWAGLGYYSRARNLHKAAIEISAMIDAGKGFPQSYQQLLLLPGFGPYTARAVSSLAFGEKTGVLDGNVIRVLSRKYGIDSDWWQMSARNELQIKVDQLAQTDDVSELNQGLMELGATLCTPKKVLCLMCPWVKTCVSRQEDKITERPRQRPRPDFEIWHWSFQVLFQKKKSTIEIFLSENHSTPFLKKNWLPPSTAQKVKKKPKDFDLKHAVTKFDIFCTVSVVENKPRPRSKEAAGRWVNINKVSEINPTSLMKKIIGLIPKE